MANLIGSLGSLLNIPTGALENKLGYTAPGNILGQSKPVGSFGTNLGDFGGGTPNQYGNSAGSPGWSILGAQSDVNNTTGAINDALGGYAQPLAGSAQHTVDTRPVPVDPYAKFGGQAAYNNLVSGFNNQRNALNSTLGTAEQQAGSTYNQGILNFLDQQRSGQTAIDRQAQQNELAKQQATQGILGMVGRGIKSAGVTLANRNAGTSSATEALANAYGQLGRGQLSSVGNQYAQGQNAVQNAQNDFTTAQQSGVRNLGFNKENIVNSLVSDATTKLAALDAAMANASLPDRINIAAEQQRIKQDTLGQLSQFDTALQQGLQGIAPQGADEARAAAHQLAVAGTAPDTAFQYSTQAPTQFQNSGPFASDFPLFTFGGNKKQTV